MKVIDYPSSGKTTETQPLSQNKTSDTPNVVSNAELQLSTILLTPNSTKKSKFEVPDEVKQIQEDLNKIGFVI